MCLSVCINPYIIQVPGDFLSRLQTSLLLTQASTCTCQCVNDTPQHRHTSVWHLLKRHPSTTAVKCVGRLAGGNSNSWLRLWKMTGKKTFQRASGEDQQQGLMREDGAHKLRHRLSMLHCMAHPSPRQRSVLMGAAQLWPPQLQLQFGGQSNSINQQESYKVKCRYQ